MLKRIGSGLLVLSLVFIAGCAHFPGGIAPSTTPIDGRNYDVLGKVDATDSRVTLFCLIPISGHNSIQGAVDKAKRQLGADALIDVSVEAYGHFWLFWCSSTTEVEGMGIRFKK
jgi:hypothetical protein